MSLRTAFTKLVGTLSEAGSAAVSRHRPTWTGVVAIGGLVVAATASGCGCDGGGSLVPCGDAGEFCVCNGYDCQVANKNSGAGGSGGPAGTGGGVGTGGVPGTGGALTSTGGSGTGGAAPCDPMQATCPCVDGACTDGMTCIDGLCITGCDFTYQCGEGNVCANGACVPGCTSGSCPTGYTCSNGACSVDPNNPACSASTPCPAGEICANGLCTTHCTADSQCAAGQVCDGGSQTCITDPSPTPVCNMSKPCPSPEVCLTDGFCHYPCTSLSECQHIDNRFVACDSGICKTQEEIDPQCSLTKPCPAGKSCISNQCF